MKREILSGKTVVITGASSGAGRVAAQEFARNGANVVLASRNANALKEVAEECKALGMPVLTVITYVTKVGDVINLVNTVNNVSKRFYPLGCAIIPRIYSVLHGEFRSSNSLLSPTTDLLLAAFFRLTAYMFKSNRNSMNV